MASVEMAVRLCARRRKSLDIGAKIRNAKSKTSRNSRNHPQHLSRPTRRDRPHIRMNSSTGPPQAPSIPTLIPFCDEPPSALFPANNSLVVSHRGPCRLVIRWMATRWRTNFDYQILLPVGASDIMRCSLSPDKTRLGCIRPHRSSGELSDVSPRAS